MPQATSIPPQHTATSMEARYHERVTVNVSYPERSLPLPLAEQAVSTTLQPLPAPGSLGNQVVCGADSPETVLMRTMARFLGVARRGQHCVYTIQVVAGHEQFLIHKRFSECREFRRQLLDALSNGNARHCGRGPCTQLRQLAQVKFPHRRMSWKREVDMDMAQERVYLLDRFLQAMLRVYRTASRRHLRCCVTSECEAMLMIKQFLQVTAVTTALRSPTSSGCTGGEESTHKQGGSYLSPLVSSPRWTRGFPPTTRVSLQADRQASFEQQQLYPIMEDVELLQSMC